MLHIMGRGERFLTRTDVGQTDTQDVQNETETHLGCYYNALVSAGGKMQSRVPHIGDFVSTRSRGLVDIANVDPGLVYLVDSPNRPIPISNLRHSPMDRQDIWVLIHEAIEPSQIDGDKA